MARQDTRKRSILAEVSRRGRISVVDGSAIMCSLPVNGTKSASISTVKGGQVTGSGTVTLDPSARGGTFTVDAKTG